MKRTPLKRMGPLRYGRKTVPGECLLCGQPFWALPQQVKRGRKYCSRTCAGIASRGPNHVAWKGDAVSDSTARSRAVTLYPLGPCEVCGGKGTERHHKDGEPHNNERENILIVCRPCHMRVDGRTARLQEARKKAQRARPKRECLRCGRVRRVHHYGHCHACNESGRRYWRIALEGLACAVCGSTVNVQGHHVIAKAFLRDHGHAKRIWDTANLLPLCAEPSSSNCHGRHESAFKRVPRSALTPENEAFAAELELDWLLDRYYEADGRRAAGTAA